MEKGEVRKQANAYPLCTVKSSEPDFLSGTPPLTISLKHICFGLFGVALQRGGDAVYSCKGFLRHWVVWSRHHASVGAGDHPDPFREVAYSM